MRRRKAGGSYIYHHHPINIHPSSTLESTDNTNNKVTNRATSPNTSPVVAHQQENITFIQCLVLMSEPGINNQCFDSWNLKKPKKKLIFFTFYLTRLSTFALTKFCEEKRSRRFAVLHVYHRVFICVCVCWVSDKTALLKCGRHCRFLLAGWQRCTGAKRRRRKTTKRRIRLALEPQISSPPIPASLFSFSFLNPWHGGYFGRGLSRFGNIHVYLWIYQSVFILLWSKGRQEKKDGTWNTSRGLGRLPCWHFFFSISVLSCCSLTCRSFA